MRDNDEEIKWLENSITRRRLITLIISIFTFGVLLWIFLSLPFLPNASLQIYLTIAAAVVSLSLCVLYMKIVLPAQVGISHNGIYVLISKKNNWKKFVSWDDIVSIRPDIFDNYELRGVGRRFLWVNKAVRDELEGPLRIFLKEKERNALARAKTGWDEKSRRGKLLFASWPDRYKLIVRIYFIGLIISGIVSFFFLIRMLLSFESDHSSGLSYLASDIAAFDFVIMTLVIDLYAIESKEFRMYNNYIIFPKNPLTRHIPFSKISEIKLNTGGNEFITEIEIALKDGTVLKYDKKKIRDWDDFYTVMLKEVSEKVRVVE